MRSLKKVDTPILKGLQIYHNYIREHQGLHEENSSGKVRDSNRRREQVVNDNTER